MLRVWWGSDDGDDNLLWYDIDYTYDQDTCQYRCHFSGDESFVAFGLRLDDKEWLSAFENPFLFYDPDGDTCSEVVLRIEGQGNEVRAIRYSFDADDDAYGRRTHDYDFSITARAPEDRPVILPADAITSTKLRGIPTQAWLRRDKAQEFVQKAQWDQRAADLGRDERQHRGERRRTTRTSDGKGSSPTATRTSSRSAARRAARSTSATNWPASRCRRMRLYYDPSRPAAAPARAPTRAGWTSTTTSTARWMPSTQWTARNGDGFFDRRLIDVERGRHRRAFDWPAGTHEAPRNRSRLARPSAVSTSGP